MTVLYIVLILIAAFLAVLLIRTARFRPAPEPERRPEPVEFDRAAAVGALQKLVRCRTVSYTESGKEDDGEFEKLIALLPELYPRVFSACTMQRLEDRGLLFRWPGKSREEPRVFMAHYDVVPVVPDGWTKPPFDGLIEDGVMWGRGTLDTKATFNGVLFAADHLIGQGFVPEHDCWFAFSGGEEINGPGAEHIVRWFEDNGIRPGLVLDEGGAVVEDVFPGVKEPCCLIGIAEKGQVNLTFTVRSDGGHASAPKPHTPIGVLSKACCRVEDHPFRSHLTAPVREMFDTLGRHSTFLYRMIFANLWCFRGALDLLCRKTGGELNALMRTTVAFTQASGSEAPNVIPPEAAMTANLRLNSEDSVASAVAYVRSVVGSGAVELEQRKAMEPSPVSVPWCREWDLVASAAADTWPGSLVSPYLMIQCSDSRHYRDLSDRVYRFSAMDLTAEERRSIHGNDEHIRLETAGRAVEFYIRLMKSC